MTNSKDSQETAADWNEMAGAFDRWLPYIQPVAEALIDLADVAPGHQVLDVASGTGEPSLSLARRYAKQGIKIVGVDGAEAMVRLATKKASAAGFSNLTFQQMQAEALSFSKASFDRVISRFGVMLFDDPLKGLQEMRRVLRPDGKIAIAVWGEFHEISSLYLLWDLFISEMPPEKRPPMPRIGRMGPPGKLEALLREAGFQEIEVKPLSVPYRFESFDSYWAVSTDAGLLKAPLETFSPEQQKRIRDIAEARSAPFCKNGTLIFQNKALLASAVK